ncbi:MAG: type II secretion system protein [Candidatus Delongbacteria bacterium]
MMKKMNKYKGFTLIETVIVALIAGFVGLGVVFTISNSNRVLNETYIHTMTESSVRMILRELAKDVRAGAMLENFNDDPYALKINNVDGSYSIWKYDYNYGEKSYFLARTHSDGTKRQYRVYGAGNYQYMQPEFVINKVDPLDPSSPVVTGKYDKLWVRMAFAKIDNFSDLEDNYFNWSMDNTYYCKTMRINYSP